MRPGLIFLLALAPGCFHIDGCCASRSGTDTGPRPEGCGNGLIEPPEECDPPAAGFCSGDCRLLQPPPECGNGIVEPPEECDPPEAGFCDQFCQLLGPWAICGNGLIELGEECDDGNNVSGDGCSAFCEWEGNGLCGNGVIEPPEECDPPIPDSCDEECRLIDCPGPGMAPVGDPCVADCTCASHMGVTGRCLHEADWDIPGGYCTLAFCSPGGMGFPDSCPPGSRCRRFDLQGVGTEFLCVQECTPSPLGTGPCRSDVGGGYALACVPEFGNPASGYCFRGCDTDQGCRRCTEANICENDPGTFCLDDNDCPLAAACEPVVNLCYPTHPSGPADVGDPCNSNDDCPEHGLCAGAFGSAPMFWPGGYCTIPYCASFDTMPEFGCPSGSICPALYGFAGGLLNFCAAACTVDGGNGECDVNRGDAFDYECTEASQAAGGMPNFYDSIGVEGFCFQCEALFPMQATFCP